MDARRSVRRSRSATPTALDRAPPANARPSVTSSAYSRSEPTGSPLASRVTVTCGARSRRPSAMCSAVASPVVVGLVASTTSRTSESGARDAAVELGDAQVVGVDAVDRRERAAEHVVAAAELVHALERDHVGGLLDDADHAGVAPLVLADPAARALGEVEADLAQADALLDLADRVGERGGVLVGGAQDVEGEPLRGAVADPGQLRELGDQPLDRGGVDGRSEARAARARRARPGRGPPVAPPILLGGELLGRAQRLVDGREHHVGEQLRVVGVDRRRVDADLLDDQRAAHARR